MTSEERPVREVIDNVVDDLYERRRKAKEKYGKIPDLDDEFDPLASAYTRTLDTAIALRKLIDAQIPGRMEKEAASD